MGFDIDWSLAKPINAGEMFAAGLERGQAKRDEQNQRHALTAYVQKPNQQNLSALAPYQPALVLSERARLVKEEQDRSSREALAQAYGSPPPGVAQQMPQAPGAPSEPPMPGMAAQPMQPTQTPPHPRMGDLIRAGVPVEMARQINDDHIKEIGRLSDFLGQVGLEISSKPEAERPQAWAQAVQQAKGFGIDVPTEFAQYSPQALSGVLAASKQVKEAIGQNSPDWAFSPNGGLIDKHNPDSISAYQQWLAGGGMGQPPAAATGAPRAPAPIAPGAIVNGKQFKGGDYRDPNNWASPGGAGSQGPQTFP